MLSNILDFMESNPKSHPEIVLNISTCAAKSITHQQLVRINWIYIYPSARARNIRPDTFLGFGLWPRNTKQPCSRSEESWGSSPARYTHEVTLAGRAQRKRPGRNMIIVDKTYPGPFIPECRSESGSGFRP